MFSANKKTIYGFSSRKFGDCRKNPEKFLKTLGLDKKDLVLAQQVHGNKIKVVNTKDKGHIISRVDGLITPHPGVILGVRTADCLPLLFYAPGANLIGVAHAGWKGVLAGLPQKMIDQMLKMGALPTEILVIIGPHIGGCCYSVPQSRADAFLRKFGSLKSLLRKKSGKIYLNLLVAAKSQLIHSGVKSINIFLENACTSCENKNFFSFRKDKQNTYGEMLSIICLK